MTVYMVKCQTWKLIYWLICGIIIILSKPLFLIKLSYNCYYILCFNWICNGSCWILFLWPCNFSHWHHVIELALNLAFLNFFQCQNVCSLKCTEFQKGPIYNCDSSVGSTLSKISTFFVAISMSSDKYLLSLMNTIIFLK